MNMNDRCWVLNRFSGISQRTVAEVTRGDLSVEEFFTTEQEAWEAEAVRAGREAERHERDAGAARTRQAVARRAAQEIKPLNSSN